MVELLNEHVVRSPHPRLRPFVSVYTGYKMSGFQPGVHAGLPSGTLTMIISFDEQLSLEDPADPQERQEYWGMIAGLHASPARVHHTGSQHGVQLEITPRGAGALFGIPAGKLASTVVHLDDIDAQLARELIDRISSARTWRTRWAVLDEIFLRVLRFDREVPVELERAWSVLTASSGAAQISELAATAGWSRRHFTKKFSEFYGLTPKTMARVLRFERAQRMLRLPTRPALSSIAATCGYADQAHMTRDWVEFAGSAPTLWIADESLPSLQDTNDQLEA